MLGLELVRRQNKPVIIFAPTVTIKNQWVERFVSLFTDKKEVPDWISTDIYNLKMFNVVTYQALHYAYKKKKVKEEKNIDSDDEEIEKEKVTDIETVKSYNLIEKLKLNKISTFVLDEAHHLKSEWWKSLTDVIAQMENITMISLTATPPYDEEYSEFKKYTDLCGEIDETISVPELVAADNLCPHQDYIFFNYPENKELEEIKKYKIRLNKVIEEIKSNNTFLEAIKDHLYVKNPYLYEQEILENVEYYSSMLIFLNYRGISLSKDNISILGHDKKIPELSLEWLEILLKNVIISDRKNFLKYEECIAGIEGDLNRIGAIEKKELSFRNNKMLENYFINSIGKLDSISKIVDIERTNLKEKLRMVILTDYIRKEYLSDADTSINKLGVFPIFLTLRKSHPNMNMAILTGAMFIIPKVKKDNLYGLCVAHNVDTEKIKFETLSIDSEYLTVSIPNSLKNKVMSLISKLFSSGQINLIIGTKSLLGEGWDEPSINTLVLASFVGSYMLSNQMRGRAIRVNDNPRKTANIWHLVCICDDLDESKIDVENVDYNTLKRRFNSFTGISYSSNYISSGIDRLEINPPFTRDNVDKINNSMKENSVKRDAMYYRWKRALNSSNVSNSNLVQKVEMDEEETKMKKAWFTDFKVVFYSVLAVILLFGIIFNVFKLRIIYIILELILGIYIIVKFSKIKRLSVGYKNMEQMGKVVLISLYKCGYLDTSFSKLKVVSKNSGLNKIEVYITGATKKESNIFTSSLREVLSKTINQRYIITRLNNNIKEIGDYYNVPTLLGQKKEYAEVFKKYFEVNFGKCDLVYTKTAEGRKVLLKARMKSLDYKDKIINKEEYICYK